MAEFDTNAFNSKTAGTTASPVSVKDTNYEKGQSVIEQDGSDYGKANANENSILKNPGLVGTKVNDENFDDYLAPYINVNKVVHLRVGAGDTLNTMADAQVDNWRSSTVNGLCDVSDHVVLIADSLDFEFSETIEYDKPLDPENIAKEYSGQKGAGLLKAGSQMIDRAVQLAAAAGSQNQNILDAAGATYLAEYSNLQSFKGNTVELPSSLSFTFNFGRYGIFNGRKEVVEPILALASTFSMHPLGGDLAGMYKGPVPTSSWMKTQILKNMKDLISGAIDISSWVESAMDTVTDVKDNVKQAGEGGGISAASLMRQAQAAAETALDKAVKIKSGAYKAFNAVGAMALNDPGTRLLTFKIGKQIVGPLYVGSISWHFDFSSVDEYGYPCKGTISLGGLKSPHVGTWSTLNTFHI